MSIESIYRSMVRAEQPVRKYIGGNVPRKPLAAKPTKSVTSTVAQNKLLASLLVAHKRLASPSKSLRLVNCCSYRGILPCNHLILYNELPSPFNPHIPLTTLPTTVTSIFLSNNLSSYHIDLSSTSTTIITFFHWFWLSSPSLSATWSLNVPSGTMQPTTYSGTMQPITCSGTM
jgi:hypothetical protein